MLRFMVSQTVRHDYATELKNSTQEGSALKTKSPSKGPASDTITLEIRSQLMQFGRHRPSVHCRIYLLKLENLKQQQDTYTHTENDQF